MKRNSNHPSLFQVEHPSPFDFDITMEEIPQGQTTLEAYVALKEQYPDNSVILFHNGDYFYAYCEDALDVADILHAPVSTKEVDGLPTEFVALMEFVALPQAALPFYVARLVSAGRRIILADEPMNDELQHTIWRNEPEPEMAIV